MVPFHVVDDLDDGLVPAEGVQDHRPGSLQDREPLPVRMLLRRELPEQRVRRVGEDAQGAGRHGLAVALADLLEHPVVPIIGLEEPAHGARRVRGHQEHLLSRFQGLQGGIVQFPDDGDSAPVRPVVGGIHPDGPGIDALVAGGPGGQPQVDAGRGLHAVQQLGNGPVDVILALPVDQVLARIVRNLHVRVENLVFRPAVLVELGQRDELAAELPPFGGIDAALGVHERVQDAHIGRSLPGIVLDVKQLEAAEARGAEAHFHIGLVQFEGPAEGGAVESRRLVRHSGDVQPATELHQVVRGQRAGVLVDLGVIRIALELPGLVADHRHRDTLERLGEVPGGTRIEMVQNAAVHRVAESEGTADVGVILAVCLAPRPAGGEEIHSVDIALPAQESVGTIGIQDLRGFLPDGLYQLLHHRLLAPKLVAQGEHRERGVMSISTDDVQALFPQEREEFLPFQRPPERELRLEVDPELVRGRESGLRRAPGMEPDVVDAVFFAAL